MKVRSLVCVFLFALIVAVSGCGRKMPLPVVQSSAESFGANDTSYIHLTPVWGASTIGYSPVTPWAPVDIAIGDDGYLFVADNANDRIVVLSESGDLATHDHLGELGPITSPKAIDIDAKLNLLIVNGTNKVYVWNQYLNHAGVDSVLVAVSEDNRYIFSGNATLVDSTLGILLFYEDEKTESSFQGVAFGPSRNNTVFVTDKGNNRILQLRVEYSGAVKLKDGLMHPMFRGVYETDIATYGSGAGTVDDPRGITVDDEGSVYFTQLGGNFFVQKLSSQGTRYVSAYTLYEDPIMDLNRFAGPYDIALDSNDAIFVLDSDDGKVYKFFNKGGKAGRRADLGKKGLVEVVFNHPLGIAISDDDIVYVADTGNNRIERYRFSVSEEDLPVEQP